MTGFPGPVDDEACNQRSRNTQSRDDSIVPIGSANTGSASKAATKVKRQERVEERIREADECYSGSE